MNTPIYQVPGEIIDELRQTYNEILQTLKTLQDAKDPERFLTRKEFMAAAQIGETYMSHLIGSSKIKANRTTKRRLRIPYSELLKFLRGEIK